MHWDTRARTETNLPKARMNLRITILAAPLLLALASTANAAGCPGRDGWVFEDVDATSPFCAQVTWLAQQQITLGCGVIDGNRRLFCGDAPITRFALATFLERTAQALFPLDCAVEQVMKWNGSDWVCATPPAGTAGPTGPVGPQGAQGPQGDVGQAGATGAQGLAGPQGDPGPAGPAGTQGAQGAPGPQGPPGATGSQGPQGATGSQGLQGATGPQGPAGAQGATGATGPQGPQGAAGTGLRLVDANGAVLGSVVGVARNSVTVITSTGYQTTMNWAGAFSPAQIYYTSYSGGSCGGSAYLNSGSSTTASPMHGKFLVWAGSLATFMTSTASSLQSDGTAMPVKPSVAGFSIQGIDNPGCGTSTSDQYMWPLTPITRAAAGLPATIVPPLNLQ